MPCFNLIVKYTKCYYYDIMNFERVFYMNIKNLLSCLCKHQIYDIDRIHVWDTFPGALN